jgi:glycosyltransferase involved in cell wall biosynthesis
MQVCSLYYPHIGGVETHVQKLSERLVRLGAYVEVLTTDESGTLPSQETKDGVKIKRFKCWLPKIAYYYSSGLQCYLKENSSNCDIIHVHNYQTLLALFATLTKKQSKLILTPHYHSTSDNFIGKWLRIPYRFLWNKIIDKVDKFICVSKAEKLSFQNSFVIPDDKFVVIPNGVENQVIQKAQPYNIDKKVILYVGRLEKYKNIDYIIKAMPYVEEQYLLYIIGDGNYKPNLTELIKKLKLQERVKIISGVSNEEVHRWYKTCCLFVNFSELEAFGISVLEAISAEKPVILNDIPAFRELADMFNGVRVVKIVNMTPQQLAQIMTKNAKSKPQNNVLDRFSWDTIAKDTWQIYNQLISK